MNPRNLVNLPHSSSSEISLSQNLLTGKGETGSFGSSGSRPAPSPALPDRVRACLIELLAAALVADVLAPDEGGSGSQSLGPSPSVPVATHARDFKALKLR